MSSKDSVAIPTRIEKFIKDCFNYLLSDVADIYGNDSPEFRSLLKESEHVLFWIENIKANGLVGNVPTDIKESILYAMDYCGAALAKSNPNNHEFIENIVNSLEAGKWLNQKREIESFHLSL